MNVIQSWVGNCTFRQQGVLVLALRGPDGARKEDDAKPVIRSVRGVVMNSGRHNAPMPLGMKMNGDPFMRTDLIADTGVWSCVCHNFYSSIDQYNIHFVQHLLHAAAIIGFKHPWEEARSCFKKFYHDGVHCLHMHPETESDINYRLRDGKRTGEGDDVFVCGEN